jgi:putative effector of murein hydrolase
VSLCSAWGLAQWLQLDASLQQTLMPRSVTTPFAMEISARIGGIPELTAVLVIITGLIGALIGEVILAWLPRSAVIARGAAYGMAAHGVGVARAHELGAGEGAVAGLVMVLAGLLNVIAVPLLFRIELTMTGLH